MRKISAAKARPAPRAERPKGAPALRERILGAAFGAFMERGYAGASTLEIASRANVSKRELYALFEDKPAILAACIDAHARRMRLPLELRPADDRRSLADTLAEFGTAVLYGVSQPKVLALFRLAIAEVDRTPTVAQTLHSNARKANRAALTDFLAAAQARGLIAGEPAVMATQFLALLWGDLLIQMLLRVADTPSRPEIERRSRSATEMLLRLYPQPKPVGSSLSKG